MLEVEKLESLFTILFPDCNVLLRALFFFFFFFSRSSGRLTGRANNTGKTVLFHLHVICERSGYADRILNDGLCCHFARVRNKKNDAKSFFFFFYFCYTEIMNWKNIILIVYMIIGLVKLRRKV